MKKLAMMAVMGLLAGCASFRGETPRMEVNNAPVAVSAGRNLKEAVVQAATRRHWNVQELENGDLRCQILQREHRVTIDVTITGENTYSIKFVESNIPTRKYNQWIGNLQREIARWAAR